MSRWWQGLERRERLWLGGGGLVATVLLLYALVWLPLQRGAEQLRRAVAQSQSELAQMRQTAAEVRRLENQRNSAQRGRADGASPPSAGNESLATLVDRSARDAGIATALKRVEPQTGGRLSARLEQVGFDRLLRWLAALRRTHGVTIVSLSVDRTRQGSGAVNARLILRRVTAPLPPLARTP